MGRLTLFVVPLTLTRSEHHDGRKIIRHQRPRWKKRPKDSEEILLALRTPRFPEVARFGGYRLALGALAQTSRVARTPLLRRLLQILLCFRLVSRFHVKRPFGVFPSTDPSLVLLKLFCQADDVFQAWIVFLTRSFNEDSIPLVSPV